eukprot:maker-scaffold294_size218657-snap-gene-0.20 protein:Tk10432 transcript:maker-scaffold294_size218657-snap-gene-0.20-mRNA-1 annotation:"hypothetical protein SINV_13294"
MSGTLPSEYLGRRGPKRKLESERSKAGGGSGGGQSGGTEAGAAAKGKGELSTPNLGTHQFPKEHPFNRDGYRYVLAEADPHAPFRQEFDDSVDLAGKPIPGFLCRVLTPPVVLLAMHDRAPQIPVHDDRLSMTGYKFYCSIRANHAVNRGTWYFETKIVDMAEGAATRIGFAQRYANLQAPLGFDKFGYSVRSRKGTRFHEAIGKHYSDGYQEGDYIGCLISMPEEQTRDLIPASYKDKPLIKFKSHFYFEEKDGVKEALKKLKPLKGSSISFFKNGENLGEAFTDIYEGDYFPSISSFRCAKVKANFGPKFRFPPKGVQCRPMSARAEEMAVEQSLADMRFFAEKDGTLSLDTCMFPSP